MSVVNWGLLEKSQVDDEKIEEAIDRIVGNHNDNEDAHLAAGQALQSHKASEIIDHAARSVVRDKLDFDRFTIDEHFSTIDAWNKSAGVFLDNIAQMSLTTTAVTNNRQQAYITPGDSQGDAAADIQNPIWETRVQFAYNTSQEIYIIQGDLDAPAGWGFKVVNNTMYAVWIDNASVEHTVSLGTISLNHFYRLRCELVYGVSLKWYRDDELVHTETTFILSNSMIFMWYSIKTTTTASRIMYVQNLHWDADYSN